MVKSFKSKRIKIIRQIKIIVAGIFSIIILVSLFHLLNQDYLLIDEVDIQGTFVSDKETIGELTNEILDSKWFLIIPKTNIFFIPRYTIKNRLQEEFPIIGKIKIDVDDASTLKIIIKEREPEYLWCNDLGQVYSKEGDTGTEIEQETNDLSSLFDEECFFAQSTGFIFMKSPYFSDNVYKKFKHESKQFKIGDFILDSPEKFKQAHSLLQDLVERGVGVRKVIFNEFEDMIIRLNSLGNRVLYDDEELRVNLDLNHENTKRAVELMLKEKTFIKEFFEENKKLKYVDLRFPGKIIYKLDE